MIWGLRAGGDPWASEVAAELGVTRVALADKRLPVDTRLRALGTGFLGACKAGGPPSHVGDGGARKAVGLASTQLTQGTIAHYPLSHGLGTERPEGPRGPHCGLSRQTGTG